MTSPLFLQTFEKVYIKTKQKKYTNKQKVHILCKSVLYVYVVFLCLFDVL